MAATEDERYRQSSQYRLWSFSPSLLQAVRAKTNVLAQQQIAPQFPADAQPEFLTPEEEVNLLQFFTTELIRAAQFCELPTEIRATAAVFLRRFYITNSVMTYPPTELLKTCLFFGCKAEGFYIRLAKMAEMFPNTTGEQILAGEFLLCQGIRFAFDVRHPFRALEGAILELKKRRPGHEDEARINKAHGRAREILKFGPLLTDAYFHYSPSQIMMAALLIADAELVNVLLPAEDGPGDMRGKIMETLQSCKMMLEEEPPERLQDYWATPELVKSMKPLLKKLQKCRDANRADLVALQKARREQQQPPTTKEKSLGNALSDAAVFGETAADAQSRDSKRRKLEAANDLFGPAL